MITLKELIDIDTTFKKQNEYFAQLDIIISKLSRRIESIEKEIKSFETNNLTHANYDSIKKLEERIAKIEKQSDPSAEHDKRIERLEKIHCLEGYEGNFIDWFNELSKDWKRLEENSK